MSKPRLLGAGLREQFALPVRMERDRIDISHFPCNTAPFLPTGKRIVTIHDLILLSKESWSEPWHSTHRFLMNHYFRLALICAASSAHAIITDSNFSAKQIADRFSRASGRTFVIPLAADPIFHKMDRNLALEKVGKELNLKPDYVLSIGSADPRKNIISCVRAYSLLPADLREKHGLVVVLAHQSLKAEIERSAKENGILNDIVFLVNQSRISMQFLYSAASVFLFPSLHEGFGMPPLEAMACSTPVITSNRSSIPEVVGDAAIQVDPTSIRDLAETLRLLLCNREFAEDLRRRGVLQAAKFSWLRTARETLAVYDEVHKNCRN